VDRFPRLRPALEEEILTSLSIFERAVIHAARALKA
jgi:hypothetical protein